MDTIYNTVMKEVPSDKLNVRNDIVYEINSQTPFTGFVVANYDTAGISFKICYKDGVKDGPYEIYHENSQLKAKSTYKDDKPEGSYEFYHENGQLKEKRTYTIV